MVLWNCIRSQLKLQSQTLLINLICFLPQYYSSQSDTSSSLYSQLKRAIAVYERSDSASKVLVNKKRMQSFKKDAEKYNFLPETTLSRVASDVSFKVKVHIFRYPTLLANNIRVFMSLGTHTPWETFDYLQSEGLLSEENHIFLQITLALSIYIRVKAYLSQNTQTEEVSLYKASDDQDDLMHHVPSNLFVILGCFDNPIKKSIQVALRSFPSLYQGVDAEQQISLLLKKIAVNTADFMLKVSLWHFVENFSAALHALSRGIGKNVEDVNCKQFIDLFRQKYFTAKTDQLEAKNIFLVANLLHASRNWPLAVDFYSWLLTYCTNSLDIAAIKGRMSMSMVMMENLKGALNLLLQSDCACNQALGLDLHQNIMKFLQAKIDANCQFSDEEKYAFLIVFHNQMAIGDLYSSKKMVLPKKGC